MTESVTQYAALLFKLYLDRRRFRGAREFVFRPKVGRRDQYRIGIAARDGTFRSDVSLRRNTSDLATFEQVFANNAFNLRRSARWRDILTLYDDLARQGIPLILDLGANVGLASLYFAKNWPKARIVAVEPEAQNYRLMCDNLSGLANVLSLHAAVASEDGAVRIVDPGAEAYAMRTEGATPGAPGAIAALSVQSLLKKAPDSVPFIVKIDIEGYERELFSKNTDWVERFPIIVIEPHDWMLPRQGIATNFLRTVARQERDFVIVGENIVSIANTQHRESS